MYSFISAKAIRFFTSEFWSIIITITTLKALTKKLIINNAYLQDMCSDLTFPLSVLVLGKAQKGNGLGASKG